MITIVGAGMAGLLAAAMLRNRVGRVIERAPALPNNHSAVLRFRSTAVSDALNIPFKKVKVMRSVQSYGNPVANALAYSFKCTGQATLRSISTLDTSVVERYIAPEDMIQQMADLCPPIDFSRDFKLDTFSHEPIISTIPMLTLMSLLNYPRRPSFSYHGGVNVTAVLPQVDAYATVYVPAPTSMISRISLEGSRIIIEVPRATLTPVGHLISKDGLSANSAFLIDSALRCLGLIDFKPHVTDIKMREQQYAKIAPIDENDRRAFILWATEVYNIYSLGRYATWRPGLLLDDVVNDVRVITRIIEGHNASYNFKKGMHP